MAYGGKPILVLQMQRMGDLILSFPLVLWLSRCYPGRPVHVVAEDSFSRPLLNVSPHVMYISWQDAESGALKPGYYGLVINLSIREEAARLAGSLEADQTVGPVRAGDGTLRVRGPWQLYRAGLVGLGRHNRFHWADLNALDVISLQAIRQTTYPPPRTPDPDNRTVGLFVGASEPGKRPDAAFYAGLGRALLDRGLKPVLLGGKADRPVAEAIRTQADLPLLDLVGKLSLTELAQYGATLALMITPDTGPMHLAAWTGLPTLNLSVGHVNPWDTGPYQPGHLVLRSTAACARGCWSCTQGFLRCRAGLEPKPVAALAALALRGPRQRLERVRLPGLALFETGRTPEGLFSLRRLGADGGEASAADLAGEFWRRFFLLLLAGEPEAPVRQAWQELCAGRPRLAGSLARQLPVLGRGVARLAGAGAFDQELSRKVPPFWRLLASYLEMTCQNEDASPQWARASLETLEHLSGLMS